MPAIMTRQQLVTGRGISSTIAFLAVCVVGLASALLGEIPAAIIFRGDTHVVLLRTNAALMPPTRPWSTDKSHSRIPSGSVVDRRIA
jgi:hypothetical protein